jgi:SAM-dependent methyltransferase
MNLSSLLSENRGQFAYFDAQLGHPDWSRARVLDFGGNSGALFEDAAGAMEPSNYWCLDVSQEAIDAGAQRFPGAHFLHFDRWQHRYNPGGIRHHPLPLRGKRFDYILAYSVFTMIDEAETIELVTALRQRLAENGTLAFTFVDPHHRQLRNGRLITNLEWRLEVAASLGHPHDPDMAARFAGSDTCYLIEQRGIETKPRLAFETFITAARIRKLFPDCETLEPTADLRHHCCVIRR